MATGDYHRAIELLRKGNTHSTQRARQAAIREGLRELGACDSGIRKVGICNFRSLAEGFAQVPVYSLDWYLERLWQRGHVAGVLDEVQFNKRVATLRTVNALHHRMRNARGKGAFSRADAIRAMFNQFGEPR